MDYMHSMHYSEPYGHGNRSRKRTKAGRYTSDISYEELSKYFHLPTSKACVKLGVGLTILKRICRRYGLARWPYKKPCKTLSHHMSDGLHHHLHTAYLQPDTPPFPNSIQAPGAQWPLHHTHTHNGMISNQSSLHNSDMDGIGYDAMPTHPVYRPMARKTSGGAALLENLGIAYPGCGYLPAEYPANIPNTNEIDGPVGIMGGAGMDLLLDAIERSASPSRENSKADLRGIDTDMNDEGNNLPLSNPPPPVVVVPSSSSDATAGQIVALKTEDSPLATAAAGVDAPAVAGDGDLNPLSNLAPLLAQAHAATAKVGGQGKSTEEMQSVINQLAQALATNGPLAQQLLQAVTNKPAGVAAQEQGGGVSQQAHHQGLEQLRQARLRLCELQKKHLNHQQAALMAQSPTLPTHVAGASSAGAGAGAVPLTAAMMLPASSIPGATIAGQHTSLQQQQQGGQTGVDSSRFMELGAKLQRLQEKLAARQQVLQHVSGCGPMSRYSSTESAYSSQYLAGAVPAMPGQVATHMATMPPHQMY